jgi:hypothetical protein
MTKNRILKAFLLVAVLMAAINTYFAQGDKKRPAVASSASSNAAPCTEPERAQMIDEQLKSLLAPFGVNVREIGPASQTSNHQELEVRLKATDNPPESNLNGAAQSQQQSSTLTVMARSNRAGSLPRQRSLELSEQQILVVAVGADNQLRWWTLIADPRLRRAEIAAPNGELSGQTIMLGETDFTVSYPADLEITELRFFHPHWTGTKFTLESIGSTAAR